MTPIETLAKHLREENISLLGSVSVTSEELTEQPDSVEKEPLDITIEEVTDSRPRNAGNKTYNLSEKGVPVKLLHLVLVGEPSRDAVNMELHKKYPEGSWFYFKKTDTRNILSLHVLNEELAYSAILGVYEVPESLIRRLETGNPEQSRQRFSVMPVSNILVFK